MIAYVRATWDDSPDIKHLHRGRASAEQPRSGRHPCGDTGPRKRASTPSGGSSTYDGRRRLINRCELFDEADLDAALARFDRTQPPAPRLENAASRVDKRFQAYFAARDWDVMAEMLSVTLPLTIAVES